jgi:hypothetical protein
MPFFSDKFRRLVTTYHCASVDVGTEADCKGNPRRASTPVIERSISHPAQKSENKFGAWADQIASLSQETQRCT